MSAGAVVGRGVGLDECGGGEEVDVHACVAKRQASGTIQSLFITPSPRSRRDQFVNCTVRTPLTSPSAVLTLTCRRYSPGLSVGVPVMMPVSRSICRPAGNVLASIVNCMGDRPPVP